MQTVSRGNNLHEMSVNFLLKFSILGKKFKWHFEIFSFIFSHKNTLRHFMQVVSMETICMKCQSLFSGKTKKNIINLSSTELAQKVINVKMNMWCAIQENGFYEDSMESACTFIDRTGPLLPTYRMSISTGKADLVLHSLYGKRVLFFWCIYG